MITAIAWTICQWDVSCRKKTKRIYPIVDWQDVIKATADARSFLSLCQVSGIKFHVSMYVPQNGEERMK